MGPESHFLIQNCPHHILFLCSHTNLVNFFSHPACIVTDLPFETVSGCNDPVRAEDGTTTRWHMRKTKHYLPGPGVRPRLLPAHNPWLRLLRLSESSHTCYSFIQHRKTSDSKARRYENSSKKKEKKREGFARNSLWKFTGEIVFIRGFFIINLTWCGSIQRRKLASVCLQRERERLLAITRQTKLCFVHIRVNFTCLNLSTLKFSMFISGEWTKVR